ncbi:hypothetical protein OPV22_034538 [Ensete ventricosum]|uniref:BAG domain-containing protein n=1 Tax=Ensete ventricosum TaxID=4639 RepID=A0AAV8PSR2_ENSVE|nr:hypothetical protein OPV22_034538 [Ensete ventricosum]
MFTGSSLHHPEMGREEKGAPVADAIDLSAIDGPPSHLQLRQPPPYDSSASLWPRTLLLRFLGEFFNEEDIAKEAVQKDTMALQLTEVRQRLVALLIDCKKKISSEPSVEES